MTAKRFLSILSCMLLLANGYAYSQDRETKVRNDRTRIIEEGFWIYNNVEKGLEQAKQTGKPLLVIFRCIPCEACAQLDEKVVEKNPVVRKWLSQFVCVRVVHANAMDLSRFQFDYDQSWAAFFLNGDGTIYGRYGTRSHQTESDGDVTLDGFLDTLNAVMEVHKNYPSNKLSLAAKSGDKVAVAHPEDFPKLKAKYDSELDYKGKVVQSCIHCHQVGEAWRDWYRDSGKPVPTEIVFPYPHPKVLGMIMDPTKSATVEKIAENSAASRAGLVAGDKLTMLDGQSIVSVADVQWVLHRASARDQLPIQVDRAGKQVSLTLALPSGWRESGDIAWRASSWGLRRTLTGGLKLDGLAEQDRKEMSLDPKAIGLRVRHVGQFGAHAAAKRAGFKEGDVFVSVDGISEPMTESQLFARLINHKKVGENISVVVARGPARVTLELPIQE